MPLKRVFDGMGASKAMFSTSGTLGSTNTTDVLSRMRVFADRVKTMPSGDTNVATITLTFDNAPEAEVTFSFTFDRHEDGDMFVYYIYSGSYRLASELCDAFLEAIQILTREADEANEANEADAGNDSDSDEEADGLVFWVVYSNNNA